MIMAKKKAVLDRSTIERIAQQLGASKGAARKWFHKGRRIPKAWKLLIESRAREEKRA
jgi:hypothetical protein